MYLIKHICQEPTHGRGRDRRNQTPCRIWQSIRSGRRIFGQKESSDIIGQQGVHNIQEVIDSDTNVVTLSLDLSKAFERINPWWILHILSIRGAPYWVIQYTKYILFDRRSKQKVQGKLLPAKVILTGVDMGRSFSVLLFCIAMDPILQYLNCVPGILCVQGYVDDTTMSGDTKDDLHWLTVVGSLCENLASAGIMVDPHRCWRAIHGLMRNLVMLLAWTKGIHLNGFYSRKLSPLFLLLSRPYRDLPGEQVWLLCAGIESS